MYSVSVTESQLAAAQSLIDRRPRKTDRYQLERIPLHRIDAIIAHFNDIIDDAGNLDPAKRPKGLTPREREIIEGQRIVCKLDFLYWSSRYAWIKSTLGDTGENVQRFRPNVAQQADIMIWSEHEEKFWPILMLELKARQNAGKTTLWQIAIAHRIQFYKNVNALMGSSDPEKTRHAADDKLGRVLRSQPWWLLPEGIQYYQSGEIYCEIPLRDTTLTIQHGTQRSGVARGDTIDVFHLTEPAEYAHPEEIIDASLLNTIHENPMTLGCIEGTAKGDTGWLNKKWEVAKKLWPRISKLRPHFTPWWVGTDVWPTRTWLLNHPVPDDWQPDELTQGHAAKAAVYAANDYILRRLLGDNWQMSREQQWFWEASRIEAEETDTLEKFLEERPGDDIECFQAVGYSIFSPQVLLRVTNTTRPLATYTSTDIDGVKHAGPAVFAIVGHEIPKSFDPAPSQIDRTRKPIRLVSNMMFNQPPIEFHLVPLKFEGFTPQHEMNRLYVWEMSNARSDYGCGVDLGDGIGKDRSAAEVLRKGTASKPAEQVAEFVSDQLNIIEFAPFAFAIGLFYSQVRRGPAAFNQIMMAIETNRAGYATQDQLRKWGWSNIPDRRGARDQRVQRPGNRLGWVTTGWNRDEIIAKPAKYIKSGDLLINSPWLISEMKTLKRGEDSARIEASKGHYDDRYFGMGICFINLEMDSANYRGDNSAWEDEETAAGLAAEQAAASLRPDLTSWRILPVPSGTGTTGAFDDPERFR
jgi:hypothetical protein